MKIEHLAIWVKDLEAMRNFYEHYFGAESNDKYINEEKGFESYFLSFDTGARLEIMHMDSIPENNNSPIDQYMGLIHFAISVDSRDKVDDLTDQLKSDGFEVVGKPRVTGDGYYESVILDPEGNRIEITE